MKTFFSLAIALFTTNFFAHSSLAGSERYEGKDMKSVVQPVVEEHCNWTGFYIGAHVGYGWNNLTWTDTDTSIAPDPGADTGGPELLTEHRQNGVMGGGQLGYNRQFGHFVVGAEGEFSFSDIGGSSTVTSESFVNRFETNNDWVGTFGLRLGFAWNRVLFYAKGGGAVVHQEYSLDHTVLDEGTPFPVDRFTADETRVCPMVGGGVEYAFTCHWSAKVEYSHLFLGAEDIDGTNVEASATGAEPESYRIDRNQDTVKVGLNYKF